jgi:hypothetical protein
MVHEARFKPFARAGLVLTFVLASLLCMSFVSLPPRGRFRVDDVGTTGLSYLELKSGIAYLVVEGAADLYVGYYTNQNRRWYLVGHEATNVLKADVWRLTMKEGSRSFHYPRTFKKLTTITSDRGIVRAAAQDATND